MGNKHIKKGLQLIRKKCFIKNDHEFEDFLKYVRIDYSEVKREMKIKKNTSNPIGIDIQTYEVI